MRNEAFQQAPKARPSILVYGNAQARVIEHVLTCMPQLTDRYDVKYIDASAVARKALPECTVLFDQRTDDVATPSEPTIKTKSVRFPIATFNLLWPFDCPNPFNVPA